MDRSCVGGIDRVAAMLMRLTRTHFYRAKTLKEAHTEGMTREDIEGALKSLPFVRLML